MGISKKFKLKKKLKKWERKAASKNSGLKNFKRAASSAGRKGYALMVKAEKILMTTGKKAFKKRKNYIAEDGTVSEPLSQQLLSQQSKDYLQDQTQKMVEARALERPAEEEASVVDWLIWAAELVVKIAFFIANFAKYLLDYAHCALSSRLMRPNI